MALIALVGCSGAPASTTPQAAPPTRARIVATERGAQSWHLVMIQEDGTRIADLTTSSVTMVRDNNAAWSPDGKWIAFTSSRGRKNMTETSIWIVEAKVGAQPRRLTSDSSIDFHPAWTPDSKWIVYASQRKPGESSDLYRVEVIHGRDGTLFGAEPQPVTRTSTVVEWTPTVSPDGKWVAYTAIEVGGDTKTAAIWKRPLGRAGKAIRLTKGPADVTPAWSPSGKQIAFVARGKAGIDTDLFTIPSDAQENPSDEQEKRTLVIADPLGQQTGPRWSKTGRWLFSTSIFVQLTTGKALHSSVTYTEPGLPKSKRRLCALQDPVAGGSRLEPTLAPERLDAKALRRCKPYQDALRTVFDDLVRRRMDQLREEHERREREKKRREREKKRREGDEKSS